MALDPLSAGIGAVGSLAGNIMQSINAKKQREFDLRENEKNRAWNSAQAEKANQWSIDQWERNNQYNAPEAQMQRALAAGLNPDLMYGQSSGGAIASQSPQVTPTSPSSPTSSASFNNLPNYGNVVSSAMQMGLVEAQIEKTKADTQNTDADTSNKISENGIISADALSRAALNEQTLELGKSSVYVNHTVGKMNHKQLEVMSAHIGSLDAQTNSMYESISTAKAQQMNLNAATMEAQVRTTLMSKQFDMSVRRLVQDIRESDSRISLNYNQVKDVLATQAARVLNLNSDSMLKTKNAVKSMHESENLVRIGLGIDIQNDLTKFNFDQAKNFDSMERHTNIATKWINTLTNLLNVGSKAMSR